MYLRSLATILLLLLWLLYYPSYSTATTIKPIDVSTLKEDPRIVIALYDSQSEEHITWSNLHNFVELPLNHLGLILEYHDIQDGFPTIHNRDDVRGIVTAFTSGFAFDDPLAFITYASKVIKAGKKLVIVGEAGFYEDSQQKITSREHINQFLELLGLTYTGHYEHITYDITFPYKDPSMIDFERTTDGYKVPYLTLLPITKHTTSHLIVKRKGQDETEGHLIVTGPNGGIIAPGYGFYRYGDHDIYADEYAENKEDSLIGEKIRKWFINPFEFFALAFDTNSLPKADTTTIAGRRIYYSHVDGDGWNNRSQLEEHTKDPVLSAEVVLERIVKVYSDLPVTIGVIAADIDPTWAGNKQSREAARQLLKQPHVEAGSHTYSHPFYWEFFADGNPEKEIPYLPNYKGEIWRPIPLSETIFSFYKKDKTKLHEHYDIPRAFAYKPFDLNLEIEGSIKEITSLLPKGKKVEIVQWSGDTLPFEEAIAKTREAKVQNINGGDSRFDRDFPSISWVSPLGRKVGNERQIYASNSNENTYTDLWTNRFYGFKYLVKTIKNTETPIRLKPFNIYYHMYSGEKRSSLNALTNNLDYARTQSLTPITTSLFSKIAQGFYSTKIYPLAQNSWLIANRGENPTIRFDNHLFKSVDFAKSSGIIGQRYFQGNLYVYLDNKNPTPIITLKDHRQYSTYPRAIQPYLIDSRYRIWDTKHDATSFYFTLQGFGQGNMRWYVPQNGSYKIFINGTETHQVKSKKHIIDVELTENVITPVSVKMTRIE